jgi:hypothetical protein
VHFRRQFLVQLLILLDYLLTLTPPAKDALKLLQNAPKTPLNPFTLEPEGETWVRDALARATDELAAASPAGRAPAAAVRAMLARDHTWAQWKLAGTHRKEREAWSVPTLALPEYDSGKLEPPAQRAARWAHFVSLWDDTAPAREALHNEQPEEWPHKLGSNALTEIWAMGYRSMTDLEMPPR